MAELTERGKMVSMRAVPRELDMIDRAAALSGKTRTAFVLDAAKRQAEDILKDRTRFMFTADEWEVFTAKLDAPVSAAERRSIAKLLSETPMWERGE